MHWWVRMLRFPAMVQPRKSHSHHSMRRWRYTQHVQQWLEEDRSLVPSFLGLLLCLRRIGLFLPRYLRHYVCFAAPGLHESDFVEAEPSLSPCAGHVVCVECVSMRLCSHTVNSGCRCLIQIDPYMHSDIRALLFAELRSVRAPTLEASLRRSGGVWHRQPRGVRYPCLLSTR